MKTSGVVIPCIIVYHNIPYFDIKYITLNTLLIRFLCITAAHTGVTASDLSQYTHQRGHRGAGARCRGVP